jgi:hypothetical protein
MKDDDKVSNQRELYEVKNPFPWHLRREDPKSRVGYVGCVACGLVLPALLVFKFVGPFHQPRG